MKILIISSCTGEKKLQFKEQLSLQDFQNGNEHIAMMEQKYAKYLLPAEQLYTGQQHVRLMEAVNRFRKSSNDFAERIDIDLFILSAGYGLIQGDQKILPYEVTFNSFNTSELLEWANALNIPADFRSVLNREYDLAVVILGEKYWQACDFSQEVNTQDTVLAFCNKPVEKKIKDWDNFISISMANKDGKRFKCNLIGLKGELTARLLRGLSEGKITLDQIRKTPEKLADALEKKELAVPVDLKATLALPLPHIDKVITLSEKWKSYPHRQKLRYFIPDWDDLVDPDYDFGTDEHASGKGGWPYEEYAHQIYDEPNYDGILVSKSTLDEDNRRRARTQMLGVHRYLRVPEEFPVMGDCGAFGYFKADAPPYTTAEILNYYTDYGFDLGVSIDHIIIDSLDEATKKHRYGLTIQYADEFLNEHKRRGLNWMPIGAVQGWDPDSYAQAAAQYVQMGYTFLGIGGLAKRNTADVMRIVEKVTSVVPKHVQIHLFGIARLNSMRLYQQMGITSVDSASYLRKAWLGAKDNYYTLDGDHYAAIRIPEVEKSSKAKKAIRERGESEAELKSLEVACLNAVRGYDQGSISLDKAINLLTEYDKLLNGQPNTSLLNAYKRTLEAQPWKKCPCKICQEHGIEVALFRNNNRNRRRGFHNTFVFFQLLMNVLNDTAFFVNKEHKLFENHYLKDKKQMELFM